MKVLDMATQMNFLNEFCWTRFANVLNIMYILYPDMMHIICSIMCVTCTTRFLLFTYFSIATMIVHEMCFDIFFSSKLQIAIIFRTLKSIIFWLNMNSTLMTLKCICMRENFLTNIARNFVFSIMCFQMISWNRFQTNDDS